MSNLSTAQLTTYYNLCSEKEVAPKDTSSMTSRELSLLIESLIKMPRKATLKQLDMLRDMLQELVNAGIEGIRMPGQAFWDKCKNEQPYCSKWIDDVRALRAKHIEKMPPTEQQIEQLAKMYLCPDICWESVSVQKRETITAWNEEGFQTKTKTVVTETVSIERRIELGDGLWSYMDESQFKEELKKKLTHASASRLIDEFESVYRQWIATRATEVQKQQIRELEGRMANLYVPKMVVVAETEESEDTPLDASERLDSLDVPFVSVGSKQYNPVAYQGYTEQQISMLSREEANQYIRILRSELKDREMRAFTGAQELSGDFEDMRTAKDKARARTKEYEALNNFMHGLENAMGYAFEYEVEAHDGKKYYTVDSLRHETLRVFFNDASEEKQQFLRDTILSYMREAVKERAINITRLLFLADRSELASELIDTLIKEPETAMEILASLREQ
jgi:hypothetical protein